MADVVTMETYLIGASLSSCMALINYFLCHCFAVKVSIFFLYIPYCRERSGYLVVLKKPTSAAIRFALFFIDVTFCCFIDFCHF